MEILREGSQGEEVGRLHQALVETGLIPDEDEVSERRFGPSTQGAVEDFQSRHQDARGDALAVDSAVGPLTWAALLGGAQPQERWTSRGWRCDFTNVLEPMRRVLEVACGEIGSREQPPGSNRGPRVDQYTNWVGVPADKSGPPWCAAFASWCWTHASGGSPFGRLLSVYKISEWARNERCIVPAGTPLEPGDVWCILGLRGSRFSGHCGLVAHVFGDGTAATIEGNSGGAVRGLIRPAASFTTVVRPWAGAGV